MASSILFATLLILAGAVHAQPTWTHWRGPLQNGVSAAGDLIESWSPAGDNVLWQSPIGGRAAPIILNGRVYLNCRTSDVRPTSDRPGTAKKEPSRFGEQVVCWDADTGELLWRDTFNVFQTDIAAERVGWASMAGDGETGNVYMHSVSGLLRCYSGSGRLLWQRSLFEEFGKLSGFGGRTQSPIIDQDKLIVGFPAINWGASKAPPPKDYVYAFDKRTGELLWTSAPGGPLRDTTYAVPIARTIDGERLLICGNGDGGCYALQAGTGKPVWSFRMSKRGLNSSPVSDGRYVYICHGEDNIDSNQFGRIQCIDARGRGDITKSHSVWRVDGISAGYASPVLHDGMLYVVSDAGVLHALDARTGQQLWRHSLGTAGKGSPVWADGKLYITEVDGNVHILRPSRGGCVGLSHHQLVSHDGNGHNDTFASFAVGSGRLFLVTRDGIYCLGKNNKSSQPNKGSDRNKPDQRDRPDDAAIAQVQLVPFEVALFAGQSVDYRLRAFDRRGRFLRELPAEILPDPTFGAALRGDGQRVAVQQVASPLAGTVVARSGSWKATARLRVFPPLNWKWDFEGPTPQVPAGWIRAFGKLQPVTVAGSTVLRNRPGKGRPSTYIWLGTSSMRDYDVQADVMSRRQRRRMSSVGVTAQRYNLILNGNTQSLEIRSWAAQRRMAVSLPFSWEPDDWYTMKLRVNADAVPATIRGKVWKRGEPEPNAWTIEARDPFPNRQGSPGLYIYSLSDSHFDNLTVSQHHKERRNEKHSSNDKNSGD